MIWEAAGKELFEIVELEFLVEYKWEFFVVADVVVEGIDKDKQLDMDKDKDIEADIDIGIDIEVEQLV